MLSPDSPLRLPTYRRLFAAQAAALAGTGIASVALALLAFDLQPDAAVRVLGSVLALKMIVYVSVSLASQWVLAVSSRHLSPKGLLVALDAGRAAIVLALPFVSQPWQIYLLIAALSACAAIFKPVFQASLPSVLPREAQYTRALSLTRLAYDLENVLSPALAAALLTWLSPRALFGATALGFVGSGWGIARCALPNQLLATEASPLRSAFRAYLRTPRLRGLLALNLSVAAAGTLAIVHTVHIVRVDLQLGERSVALAMLATGAGSLCTALALPWVLERVSDRRVMLCGAGAASACLAAGLLTPTYRSLLMLWFALGAASAAVQTPVGRLVVRSVHPQTRTGAFAVQFSASHACWLVTYGLAALLPATHTSQWAFASFSILAALGTALASLLWRRVQDAVEHTHDLPANHPHLRGCPTGRHTHEYIIDEHHPSWPTQDANRL